MQTDLSYLGSLLAGSVSHYATYNKGELILGPDDDSDYIYVVRTGLVKAYTLNAKGDESIVIMYGPGELFPLTWIINQKRQPIYFQTMNDSELLLISKTAFTAEIKTNSVVTFAIMQRIIEQYVSYVSRVSNLGLQYARERVAYLLLTLAARLGHEKFGMISLPHISHRDLAAAVNVARESVSREISRLERQKIIDYTQSRILIIEPQLLRTELSKDITVAFYDDDQT